MTRLAAIVLLAQTQVQPAPTLEESVGSISKAVETHSRYEQRDGAIQSRVSLDSRCVLAIEERRPRLTTTSFVPLAAVDGKSIAVVPGKETTGILVNLKEGTPNVIRQRMVHEGYAPTEMMAPVAVLRVTNEATAKRIVTSLQRAVTICEDSR